MLHVTAIIRARPEHLPAVGRALAELATQSRAEPGCLRYEVYTANGELVLLTQETWADAAAESAHMAGPNVAAAFAAVGSLLAAPPDIHRCTQLA